MEMRIPSSRKSILLLTNYQAGTPIGGGRELLYKLNHDLLKDLYGDGVVVFTLKNRGRLGLRALPAALRGHIDGIDDIAVDELLDVIAETGVQKLFIDGSNLGTVAQRVKARFPQVTISTFFHNVEAAFFLGALKRARSPRALAVLAANYLAERRAVRHSDQIICLSQRDSRQLGRLYGRQATHISPMALEDGCGTDTMQTPSGDRDKFALFVGGPFYGNLHGVAWFVEKVVPRIDIKLCIVGRGFEKYRSQLQRSPAVEVVGGVDSVADWYHRAQFVVAPILEGSGMKTKVAEGLMYGKTIIGTPEAFCGYEEIAGTAGVVCTEADEFVDAIRAATRKPPPSFDPQLRSLFKQLYSYEAARTRFSSFLGALQ
jgi:glycosyltransferase involved in cell wall biosynthesis